ncbi:transposase family protein [Nostoc sp. CENA67]|uniref:Transposase family protein n=1 Tax=Amazonocrinis nigriterrae CENA67 TaxID=2794033 RepID=A0A8J7HRA2_9NOST|nr:transposase family protein [Amazonocrinis nigriterrae]MBH8564067.1 transposase family protein [Amazonocrinis nigriterrae CENA67]
MNNLLEQLQQVPDYRHIRGRRHQLWLVLFVILLGAMTGYWGYRPLEDFTKIHKQSLIELLNLDATIKFPSYSTFLYSTKNCRFSAVNRLIQ